MFLVLDVHIGGHMRTFDFGRISGGAEDTFESGHELTSTSYSSIQSQQQVNHQE